MFFHQFLGLFELIRIVILSDLACGDSQTFAKIEIMTFRFEYKTKKMA